MDSVVVTLPLTIKETLRNIQIYVIGALHLNAGVILVVTVHSVRYSGSVVLGTVVVCGLCP